jgi:hypothetical protein
MVSGAENYLVKPLVRLVEKGFGVFKEVEVCTVNTLP